MLNLYTLIKSYTLCSGVSWTKFQNLFFHSHISLLSQCRVGEADIAFTPKKYQLSQSQSFSQFYCAIARVRNFPRYKKVMEPSSLPIGIDLGTTYCCVGVFQNGSVEVIANEQGSRITPSTVAFTARERLVGEAAQFQRLLDPANVVYNAKRFIGRKFEDAVVQENKTKLPFKFQDKNNKVRGDHYVFGKMNVLNLLQMNMLNLLPH